jgi:hypothetical protein
LAIIDQHFKVHGGVWKHEFFNIPLGSYTIPLPIPLTDITVAGNAKAEASVGFAREGLGLGVSGTLTGAGTISITGGIGIPVLFRVYAGLEGNLTGKIALAMSASVDLENNRMNYNLPNLTLTLSVGLDFIAGLESPFLDLTEADEEFAKAITGYIPGSSYSDGQFSYTLSSVDLIKITSGTIQVHSLSDVSIVDPTVEVASPGDVIKEFINDLKAQVTSAFNLAKGIMEALGKLWDGVKWLIKEGNKWLPWNW